jgi:formate--tetrahydrofolate ligase
MKPDILINQEAKLLHIDEVASKLGIGDIIEPYGKHKAKVDYTKVNNKPNGKLILVTAINPTPHGEGKTTTTIGLSDALNALGKKSIVCLREPAMGPVFGKKGGATGGGYSQIAPMEDINLEFTGDFFAVAQAHNLLASIIDNHIYYGNELNIEKVTWKRVIDINDRSLRDEFDIVVASEVMAILCLVNNMEELRERLGDITVGFDKDGNRVYAKQLDVVGSMLAILRNAIKPNLVQTLEGNPALVHMGPFANIAHGCNSIIATKLGLQLSDYVVTEAGFGSDLGMEKFIDIKCRELGRQPDLVVLVATIKALKYNGDGDLTKGICNLHRHILNIQHNFNLPVLVCINKFDDDSTEELYFVDAYVNLCEVESVVSTHWKNGSSGALTLAEEAIRIINENPYKNMLYGYNIESSWTTKLEQLAKNVYGIGSVCTTLNVQRYMRDVPNEYPICVAKTPESFTADPTKLGNGRQHTVWVNDVELKTGARMVVIKLGNILTLPGLPEKPSAKDIDYINGKIIGLK